MIKNKLVILGLLNENNMHGYELINVIKQRHINQWADLSIASIYKTLDDLCKEGMITQTQKRVGRMPERNVFSITKSGKQKLKLLVKDGLETLNKKNDVSFLLAVAFINNIEKKQAKKLLNIRLKNLKKIAKELEKVYGLHKEKIPFNWLHIIVDFKTKINLKIENLKKLIEKIKQ